MTTKYVYHTTIYHPITYDTIYQMTTIYVYHTTIYHPITFDNHIAYDNYTAVLSKKAVTAKSPFRDKLKNK